MDRDTCKQATGSAGRRGGCESESSLTTAIVIALVLILVVALSAGWLQRHGGGSRHQSQSSGPRRSESFHVSETPHPDAVAGDDSPERHSVYAALNRLYSTADVDPLITGQLYAFADGVRNVYAERTSHGDVHGLTEYSSSGGPGDVGVDVGPWGLEEYGGKEIGYDDGIPEAYSLPSTPIRWYGPKQRDYYGPEGPTVYSEGLYSLTEPDHDPLMG